VLPGDPASEERRGIFGLETEHAILYLPEDPVPGDPEGGPDPRPPPRFEVLQRVLFDCLLAGRKAALSSGLKGGYFLENGGLAHVEIYLQTPSDSPILEMATPECRTPWDLAAYSRAYDSILEETSRRSAAVLQALGHSGRIVFGKNNVDSQGVGFGCHENYLVHSKPDASVYIASAAAFPFLLVAFLPTLLLIVCIIALALGAFLAIKLLEKVFPSILTLIGRLYEAVLRLFPRLAGIVRVFYFVFTNLLLYPAIIVYSLLLRRVAFRPFLLDLTPFLATRPIIAGAGGLDFRRGVYALSQRARLT
jgi:pup-ligase protein